jgi:hypothetical protein
MDGRAAYAVFRHATCGWGRLSAAVRMPTSQAAVEDYNSRYDQAVKATRSTRAIALEHVWGKRPPQLRFQRDLEQMIVGVGWLRRSIRRCPDTSSSSTGHYFGRIRFMLVRDATEGRHLRRSARVRRPADWSQEESLALSLNLTQRPMLRIPHIATGPWRLASGCGFGVKGIGGDSAK